MSLVDIKQYMIINIHLTFYETFNHWQLYCESFILTKSKCCCQALGFADIYRFVCVHNFKDSFIFVVLYLLEVYTLFCLFKKA